jgi:hypothetical protein
MKRGGVSFAQNIQKGRKRVYILCLLVAPEPPKKKSSSAKFYAMLRSDKQKRMWIGESSTKENMPLCMILYFDLAAPETFFFHGHGRALNEIQTLHHLIRIVFFFAPSTRAAERRAHRGCVHGEFSVETC